MSPLDENKRKLFRLQAEFYRVFANELRLSILCLLSEGEKSVGELAEAIGVTLANASQHLRVMKDHRVVESRKAGQTVYYRVASPKIVEGCRRMQDGLIEAYSKQEFILDPFGVEEPAEEDEEMKHAKSREAGEVKDEPQA